MLVEIQEHPHSVSPEGSAHISSPLMLSVVIPVYNEVENIGPIFERIVAVLATAEPRYRDSYEIIFVDDGSEDGSFDVCAALQERDPRVSVVQFRRNFGKTAALHAGFRHSAGQRIVTIDADMQEDPAEMFKLLGEIDNGYDLVCAWRKQRNDPPSKTVPSRLFNLVVSKMTGVSLHDFNCGFKAYTREVTKSLNLHGEQHRFIPVLAHERGYRVKEVAVSHRPRRFGRSKFGVNRLGRGYLDFLQVLFLITYLRHPLRLFGSIGTLLTTLGTVICLYLTILWLYGERPIGDRPLLTLGVLMLISGLQFISTGLVSEMMVHTNYRAEDAYVVRQVLRQRHDNE